MRRVGGRLDISVCILYHPASAGTLCSGTIRHPMLRHPMLRQVSTCRYTDFRPPTLRGVRQRGLVFNKESIESFKIYFAVATVKAIWVMLLGFEQ